MGLGYGAALEAAAAGEASKQNSRQWAKSAGSTASSAHSAFSCGAGASRRDSPIHLSTVGRREVLAWLNDALDLSLSNISQAQTGAVACQMLDRLHPGVLPMKKVDFNANTEWNYQQNWRLFQRALVELDIRDYSLDVMRCAHGHKMELLQTFRWLKVRYESWEDHMGVLPPYDAPKKRAATKTGDLLAANGGTPLSSRYHVRSTVTTVCRDEPEDMLHHGHCASGKAAELPREAVLSTGSDSKRANRTRSVHFGGSDKQRTGFWSRLKCAMGNRKSRTVAAAVVSA